MKHFLPISDFPPFQKISQLPLKISFSSAKNSDDLLLVTFPSLHLQFPLCFRYNTIFTPYFAIFFTPPTLVNFVELTCLFAYFACFCFPPTLTMMLLFNARTGRLWTSSVAREQVAIRGTTSAV